MAASKMPVPVADRRLSLNSAASGFAPGGATGGTRWTRLCKYGTASLGAANPVERGFELRQAPEQDERREDHPRHPAAPHLAAAGRAVRRRRPVRECAFDARALPCLPLPVRKGRAQRPLLALGKCRSGASLAGCPHLFRGRQTRIRPTSAAMEQPPEATPTSHGPWKFDTKNCGTAKATPATSAAGQTPHMPRQPANAATTQNGTRTEKNDNWRPTIAEIFNASRPVTCASVVIGMPSEPNATGAVLAIRARPEACKGRNPS